MSYLFLLQDVSGSPNALPGESLISPSFLQRVWNDLKQDAFFPGGSTDKELPMSFKCRASSFADQRRACTITTTDTVKASASSLPKQ